MKRFALLALLMSCFLYSEEDLELIEGVSYLDVLGGEPSAVVADCVNVFSGDFFDLETDVVVPGNEPLSLKRFYCSSQKEGSDPFRAWRFNHDIFVKTKEIKNHTYPTLCEAFGSRIPFKGKNHTFTLSDKLFEKRITNTSSEMSGRSNLKNKSMHLTKGGRYYLKDGAGGNIIFRGGPDSEKSFAKQVTRPNFNHINYAYEKNRPSLIEAWNQKGNKFGQIAIDSTDSLLKVKSTGQKEVTYHTKKVNSHGKKKWILTNVDRTYAPHVSYQYDEDFEKITSKQCGDRFLEIKYLTEGEFKGRVHALKAPLGSDNTPLPMFRFQYFTCDLGEFHWTHVYDAHNHLTTYHFGLDERLDEIVKFNGKNPYSKERFFWGKGAEAGNLTSRSLSSQTRTVFCKTYEYDAAGNVLSELIFGNLTGGNSHPLVLNKNGIPRKNGCEFLYLGHEYSKDGCNLITYENHPEHEHDLLYEYHPGTTLMRARFTVEKGKIKIREFFDYDASGAKILEMIDNGSSLHRDDLLDVSERRIKRIHNTQSFPLGLPEVIEERYVDLSSGDEKVLIKTVHQYDSGGRLCQKTIFDSEGKLAYTQSWTYNDRGDVIKEIDPLGQVIIREYDDHGNKIFEETPSHVRYKNTYDFMNRLIREEESGILSKSCRYDRKGNRIAAIDIYGNETKTLFDPFGREKKVIYPDGSSIEKSYDLLGNVTCIKDAKGAATFYKYTLHGKPFQISYPDGSHEEFLYSLKGALLKKTHKNSSYTLYTYDFLSRPNKEEWFSQDHKLLNSVKRKYNAFHLLEETDGAGFTTYYSYDGAGRLIASEKEGMRKEYTFDTLGRQVQVREFYAQNQFITYCQQFDLLNRVTAEWIEGHHGDTYNKVSYVYDPEGRLIETLSDKNRETTRYNFHGDPIEKIDAFGHITRINYGYPSTNTIERVDPLGRRLKNSYDSLGHLISEEYFNFLGEIQKKTTYGYDEAGNCTDIIQALLPDSSQKVTKYEFDSMNRVTACIEGAGSSLQKRSEIQYDISGNKSAHIKPDHTKLKYRYDPKGRLEDLRSSDGSVHYIYEYDRADNCIKIVDSIHHQANERAYDPFNYLRKEILGNGLTNLYEHDFLGRLTKLTLPDNSKVEYIYEGPCLTQVQRLSSSDQPLYQHRYVAFNPNLKPLKAELIGQVGTVEYTYDLLNRPTKITSQPYEELISYDSVGNILKRSKNSYSYTDLDQLKSESAHDYAYDALNNLVAKDQESYSVNLLNQITHFEYDPRGNCITADNISYQYDALDRLISVKTPTQLATYTYDADNRRLTKSLSDLQGNESSHRYLYQKSIEIGSYNQENHLQELRILGLQNKADIGSSIALELSGKLLIPLHDCLGNLVHTLNSDGTLNHSFAYSAFGEESIPPTEVPWRFSSKRQDPESGLILFGNRYYHPATCRWLTPDPLHFASGMNLYAYCKNNPIKYYDPDGRFVWAIAVPLIIWGGAEGLALGLTGAQLGYLVGASVLGYVTAETCVYLNEKLSEEVHEEKKKPSKGVADVADQVNEWLGDDVKVIENASGDSVFISKDKTKKVRFDFNNPSPHTNPHGHIEEMLDGTWSKSGPIYPTDVLKY